MKLIFDTTSYFQDMQPCPHAALSAVYKVIISV